MIECMKNMAKRPEFGRWIPVSERLPEDDKYILVSFEILHCRILADMRLIQTETVHFIQEMMIRAMLHTACLSMLGCRCRNRIESEGK